MLEILDIIFDFIKSLFSIYFTFLPIICGMVNSIIYPILAKRTSFPIEYKIGQYVGGVQKEYDPYTLITDLFPKSTSK